MTGAKVPASEKSSHSIHIAYYSWATHYERILIVLLRFSAVVLLTAIVPAVMPFARQDLVETPNRVIVVNGIRPAWV